MASEEVAQPMSSQKKWGPPLILDVSRSILASALVISYWRGGWMLWDYYSCSEPVPFCSLVDPNEKLQSALKSEFVGATLICFLILLSPQLARINASVHPAIGSIVSLWHTLLLGTSCISLWRGCWYLADLWLVPDDFAVSVWTSHLGGFVMLAIMGAAKCVLAVPALFLPDGVTDFYRMDEIGAIVKRSTFGFRRPSSRSNSKELDNTGQESNASICCPGLMNQYVVYAFVREVPPLYMVLKGSVYLYGKDKQLVQKLGLLAFDVFLSAGVIAHLVVLFWRGLWGLFDHYEFEFSEEPSDLQRTAGLSIVLGYSIYHAELIRKNLMGEEVTDSTWRALLRCLVANLYTYVMGFCCVNAWRGVWYALDFYTGTELESAALSHIIGIVGLTILGALRSVFAPPALVTLDDWQVHELEPFSPETPNTPASKIQPSVLHGKFSAWSDSGQNDPSSPRSPYSAGKSPRRSTLGSSNLISAPKDLHQHSHNEIRLQIPVVKIGKTQDVQH